MSTTIRANAWLIGLTLLLCCVVYPFVLWALAQTPFFDSQAQGSLVKGPEGTIVGSRLIAQPFSGAEFFQPRPSAVSYNASASGASNLAASNYLLRDRVARTIGPIAAYKAPAAGAKTVQDDVKAWFAGKPDIVAEWADTHSNVSQAWVNADDKHKAAVTTWAMAHPEAKEAWVKDNPGEEPKPADLAVSYFKANAKAFQKAWPKLIDDPMWSVEAVFFDRWLQEHPNVELVSLPADMVTTSGSGLDPHISLKNAQYQLDRVVEAWVKKTGLSDEFVRREIRAVLRERTEDPLAGMVGVPLVNVLETNLALLERFKSPAKPTK